MSYLTDYPSLVFGWLKVSALENGHLQNHQPSQGNSRILWIPRCCLLIENERIFSHFENEEGVRQAMEGRRFRRCRLDVGERAFMQTLEASVTGQASPLRESCTDLTGRSREGGPVNLRERSHTNPHVEPLPEAASVSSSGSTSSKIKNLFRSKAKSNQKLEKRKSSGPVYLDIPTLGSHSMDDTARAPKQKRLARSFSLNRLRYHNRNHETNAPIDRSQQAATIGPHKYPATKSATAQPPRAYSHECLYSDGPGVNIGSYGTVQESGPWERQPYVGPHVPPCSTSYRIQRNGYVRPVHPSLVQGQDFCFAVIAGDGEPVRYYASQSEEDRRRWMQALRRTAKPELANQRHFENSLRLVIQEVKNVSPKKRYFCEILLDGTLNARTTSKAMSSASSDMLFWGEEFEFHNLSNVNTLTIQLRRDPGDKKGKQKGASKKQFASVSQVAGTTVVAGSNLTQACAIASVSISTEDIQRRSEVEKWYTAYTSASSSQHLDGPPDPSNPQIRIKARYLRVDVLPQRCYRALQDYLAKNTLFLLRQLESVLTVKTKEEVAGTLVNIHYKLHRVDDLLSELTAQEIETLGNESMVFRGNSFATKAVECYLKTTGEKYLEETLGCLVQEVMNSDQDVEVDPQALGDSRSSLDENQRAVRRLVDHFWDRIFKSHSRFPIELRRAFAAIRARLGDQGRRSDLCDQVVSACIFLRYLCPAILNPVLFRLVREWPSDHRVSRAFTLVAKSIQALANFSQFGRKEDYMTFLNDFLTDETPSMRRFLMAISSERQDGEARVHSLHREDFIDLSYELAMAHQQLTQVLTKLPPELSSNRLITQLHGILRHLKSVADNNGPYKDPVASEVSQNGGHVDKSRSDQQLNDVDQLLRVLDIDDAGGKQRPASNQPPNSQAQLKQLQLKLQRQQLQQNQEKPVQQQQQQQQPAAEQQQQHYQKQQQSRQQNARQHIQQQRRVYQQPKPSSGDAPSSPVRRPQRQSPFVVPRASEEVCSILSTDSDSCGLASPSRSSWGGEVGAGDRRGSAHSTSSGLEVSSNGRDRRAAASANNLSASGVRMGTRSIQHRSVSSSEKSASELEQEVRSLSEELSSTRKQLGRREEQLRGLEEENRQLRRRAEESEAEVARLRARVSSQDQTSYRLQAALEEVAQTTGAPHYFHQQGGYSAPGRRYFPSSASSGSLHSLSLAPSSSANDLAGSAKSSTPTSTPRKPLKQTLC